MADRESESRAMKDALLKSLLRELAGQDRPMQGPPAMPSPDARLADVMARHDAASADLLAKGRDFESSLVSGAARGVAGLLDLPSTITMGATDLGLRAAAATGLVDRDKARSMREGMWEMGAPHTVTGRATAGAPGVMAYEPKTTAGEYVQTVGEFLPGVALGATAGSMVSAGLASEAAGQITEDTPLEPYARFVGAILGGEAPNAAAAIWRKASAPNTGANPINLERAARLEAEGVRVTAGQKVGNDQLIRAEMRAMDDVFSQQADDFTRAAMRRINVDGLATESNLAMAQGLIVQSMDDATRGVTVSPTEAMARAFRGVNVKYKLGSAKADRVPLIANIATRIDDARLSGAVIPSETLISWRRELGPMLSNKHAPTANAARASTSLIDAILGRALAAADRADDAAKYAAANKQYRDFLAIERAVTGTAAGRASATITPTQLANAVKFQNRRDLALGRRDLSRLATAGETIMRSPPNPGTANQLEAIARSMTPLAGGAGLGGVAGSMVGGPTGAAFGAALGALYPAARNAALRSSAVQALLARQVPPRPGIPWGSGSLAAFAMGLNNR